MKKRLLCYLLALFILVYISGCARKRVVVDINTAYTIAAPDLNNDEKNILLSLYSFDRALSNYEQDSSNENRVKLVSESKNLVYIAEKMMEYKLNAKDVSYSITSRGSTLPPVFSLKVDGKLYSDLSHSGPVFTLCNNCNTVLSYNGDGSNREKWTDSVTNDFIEASIDLYNTLILQSAYDYEIVNDEIVVKYESENIKYYKKQLK